MKNIHLLPTKNYKQDYTLQNGEVVEVVKLGQLILNEETGELLVNKSTQWAASCDTDVLVPHHIYITFDEEIKEGDHIVQTNFEKTNTQVIKCETEFQTKIANSKDGSFSKNKIILTTDPDLIKDGVQPIDDEFLEWFVKNPSCEQVGVSLNSFEECHMKGDGCSCWDTADQNLCKLYYPNYKIIIPQEERERGITITDVSKQEEPKQIKCYCGHTTYCDCGPLEASDEAKQRAANYMSLKGALESKQETLEEAAEKFVANTRLKNPISLFCEGAKWQQERMYSEEEVRKMLWELGDVLFNNCQNGIEEGEPETYFDNIIEQFKKK